MNRIINAIFLAFLLLPNTVYSAEDIKVVGLFKDKALVLLNGKNKVLRVGQEYKGFTLDSANSTRAIISYDGVAKQYQLGMAMGIVEAKKMSRASTVMLKADKHGMYFTKGAINGTMMEFIVDTGATMVTLNSNMANKLGMVPEVDGEPMRVSTASSEVEAYRMRLKRITIGGIKMNDIDATVLSGSQPSVALLGMSFLRHLDVSQSRNVMILKKR